MYASGIRLLHNSPKNLTLPSSTKNIGIKIRRNREQVIPEIHRVQMREGLTLAVKSQF